MCIAVAMIPTKISKAKIATNQIATRDLMESLYGVPSVPKEPEIHLGFWGTIQGVIRVFCTIFLFPFIIIISATVFCRKAKCRKAIKLTIVGLAAAIIGMYIGYITSRY